MDQDQTDRETGATPPATLPRLRTYDDIAELTGLAKGTLYSLVARGEIPHVRLGPRFVRFILDDILRWLENGAVGSSVNHGGVHESVNRVAGIRGQLAYGSLPPDQPRGSAQELFAEAWRQLALFAPCTPPGSSGSPVMPQVVAVRKARKR